MVNIIMVREVDDVVQIGDGLSFLFNQMAELYKVTICFWEMGHIVQLPGCLGSEEICDDTLRTVNRFIDRQNKIVDA